MANEIQFTTGLKIAKGNVEITRNTETKAIAWNDGKYFASTQTLNNWFENLNYVNINNLPSYGILWLRNCSDTDTIDISFDGYTSCLSILPSEYYQFRLNPYFNISSLYIQATSGNPILEYVLLSN